MPERADLTEELLANDEQFDLWYRDYVDSKERQRTGQETLHDRADRAIPKDAKPITAIDDLGKTKGKLIIKGRSTDTD